MAHYRVLIAHKDKDYNSVLDRNCHQEDYGYGLCDVEPFGYDYLSPETETMKVKDALLNDEFREKYLCSDGWAFGEIIQEDESLYRCDGVGDPTEYSDIEAMAMLNPEYYCTVFDGHL